MKKLIAFLLIVAIFLIPMSACKNEKPIEKPGITLPKKPQQPTDDPKIDETDYHKTVTDFFEALAETPASEFDYETVAGGVCVTGYLGTSDRVRVPEEINGEPVVAIADSAFADNKTLTVLYLPDSVTTLGKNVLLGSNAIKALHTPLLAEDASKPQYLGYFFGGMGYLDNIKVPNSLQYVSIGDVLTEISASAFTDTESLVAVVLGKNVTKVGNFAFYYCQKLKYVNMDGLTEIGEFAFASCNVLVRAVLSTQTETVGYGAFQGCGALSSMTLPFVGKSQTENTYLGYIFGAAMPDFNAGYIPAYLRTVTLLDTCTALGNYAFFECSSITRVDLPDTLTSIGVRAFEKCDLIQEISLPNSLTMIRENAFLYCASLEQIIVPQGVSFIGANAFYGCISLKTVILPDTLTYLSASAFADCFALETVDLGGVLHVGKNAFHNCISLKEIKTENTVFYEDANLID